MNKHYLVINDNGDAFRVAPTDDTYNDISTLVDGWVECTGLPGGVDAWVNEEGLLRNPQDFAGPVRSVDRATRLHKTL